MKPGLPILAALGAVLGAALVARAWFGIPLKHMMGDPAAVAGWPFYLGLVSNVGGILWTAAASIFLFSFRVQRASGGNAEHARFLLCSGLFVGVLGLDDFFMLHEDVLPKYFAIGQWLVVGSYGLAAALYVVRFASVIAQGAYPVFVAAVAMLAASVALDQIQDRFSIAFAGIGFCEDAAKLLGIGLWLIYAIDTSAALLMAAQGRHAAPEEPELAPLRRPASVQG